MNPVYHKLARHLDDLPGGYPATASGVELRILQRLFTPRDAALGAHYRFARHEIGRLLDDPAALQSVLPVSVPPGSPIGSLSR